jgi:hypothetical protein
MKPITRKLEYSIFTVLRKADMQDLMLHSKTLKGNDWTEKQKSAFIESLLLGFPCPQFIATTTFTAMNIVDGSKRIKAIIDFVNNEFSALSPISHGQEEKFKQLKYNELPNRTKRIFEETTLDFSIHEFPNEQDAEEFVSRLHSDFEKMGQKIRVVERYIEFKHEELTAGFSIIGNFNNFLNEHYPEQEATVKIEQNEKKLKLTVETIKGEKSVIEKALTEYTDTLHKTNASDDKNSELINTINIVASSNNSLIETISTLSKGLNNDIQVTVNNSIVVNIDRIKGQTVARLNELVEEVIKLKPEANDIEELTKEVETIKDSLKSITDKKKLEQSSSLSKLERLLTNAKKKGTSLNNIVKTSKECLKIVDELGTTINSIFGC